MTQIIATRELWSDPGQNDYYAFVESDDEFELAEKSAGPLPRWLESLLASRRNGGNRTDPNRILWLDCIRADAFLNLDWRDRPCDAKDPEQVARRREEIAMIPQDALRVAPLLLDIKSDRALFFAFVETDWHRVRFDTQDGHPTILAPDFDFDAADGAVVTLEHQGMCFGDELLALRRVFNLDFIGDADLGGEGGLTPAPPRDGGPAIRKRAPHFASGDGALLYGG